MYDELEPIANLRTGEAVERLSQEWQAKVTAAMNDLAARGLSSSGYAYKTRLDLAAQSAEGKCRAIYDIWLDLIRKHNEGSINRADVDFIIERVRACARSSVGAIQRAATIPNTPTPGWVAQRAQTRMQSVASGIGRELEIILREHEAFSTRPDTSFMAFLKAFGSDWLTRMSGPVTVPFAIAALFAPGWYKILFGILAIICGVFAAFRVWRTARLRRGKN